MKSLLLVLLVVFVHAAVLPPKAEANGHVLSGKLHRRMADDLRAYQQKERAATPHENFQPNYPDELLLVDVWINETNQIFTVSVETNVDLLFFLDPSYPTLQVDQPTYDPQASGGVRTNYFNGKAGERAISGQGYADVVNFDTLGVWNQTFPAIVDCDGYDPPFVGFDGVLGLAWDPSKKDDTPTPFSTPVLNIFGVRPDLPRFYVLWLQQGTYQGQRVLDWEISFGSNIASKCAEQSLASAGLYFDRKWQALAFQLDTFSFGVHDLDGDVAVVDSGVPTIQLPQNAYRVVQSRIMADYNALLGVYTTDCENAGKFDDFVFTIGGVQLAVPSTNYIVDLGLGGGKCVVAFDLSELVPYVLGTPFQWTFCTKFDVDNSEISFHNVVN